MKRRSSVTPAVALLLLACASCSRDAVPTGSSNPLSPGGSTVTLVDVTDSINVTSGAVGTDNYAGQSFVIPGTGTFSAIRFNWYTFHGTPTAFGTLFLLDREYLGLPGDLGPSTPGYVGQADAVVEGTPGPLDEVKGEYVFASGTTQKSGVTLRAGTKYYCYTNKVGRFVTSFDTDIFSGGDAYLTGYYAVPFRKAQASGRMVNFVYVPPPAGVFIDANFRLQAVAQ
jgi:hypothetical protein